MKFKTKEAIQLNPGEFLKLISDDNFIKDKIYFPVLTQKWASKVVVSSNSINSNVVYVCNTGYGSLKIKKGEFIVESFSF